jgi:hypothetical protein
MIDIPKAMLKMRKARVLHGPGEAWFYICRSHIEVCVAEHKGAPSTNCVQISETQLRTALDVIEAARWGK